ncbi:phospholipid methyltransferase [Nadsonia fulvescens var. elongata DSM 6958]|uniref:Phosphatidyl-N-methylethanolamine N-methyltransferase n=1 Tax=Nadsonia fulvescens var. elongata DSM 6958 TaxID=857566 RepID=A0A1E3PGJ4_9ASCO|nr:phospholipid methyltransferase [Nadsonia fulvescens var. elongata DSM 6958]
MSTFIERVISTVDISRPSFQKSMTTIIFNPLFWNLVARDEYKKKSISRFLGPKYGCYLLALVIFSLGIVRDIFYHEALAEQLAIWEVFSIDKNVILLLKTIGVLLFASGNILVLSSMWALGVTGTYLGDYFGILMKERVSGFPFNICDNPMYTGSTMSFAAYAFWSGKPAGITLAYLVHSLYKIALVFEEPFTADIYKNAEAKKGAKDE